MFPNYANSTNDRALIVAGDAEMKSVLQQALLEAGWEVSVWDGRQAILPYEARREWLLAIVCAEAVDSDVIAALENLGVTAASRHPTVLVITRKSSVADAIHCAEFGAVEYLVWPVAPEQVAEIAARARAQAEGKPSNVERPITAINRGFAKPLDKPGTLMIGSSRAMLDLAKQVVKIAKAPGLRAFITGETGTGKEVIARLIHENSQCTGPFRAVNCAATVEGLLESDLFGHEKGAFTGAHATKRGFWEEAANGTLFLDEITEASPAVQAKLLRALQEGVIRRVGSNTEIKVTARVIAASNQDLERAMKERTFRTDLYYRLGLVLRLPPLRERPEDIPQLALHFARRFNKDAVITPEAMEALCVYDWPGNVRELESVIQRIIAFTGRIILREDVLSHINAGETRDEMMRHYFRGVWGALPQIKPEGWPTVVELRDWYVQQVFYYMGRESAVARHVGLDVRTVNAILRKDEAWRESGEESPPASERQ